MKKLSILMLLYLISIIFIFSNFNLTNAFDLNEEGRILNDSELSNAYRTASLNENVIAFKRYLESINYHHDPNNSVGVIRIRDGAYFINFSFDKGLKEITSNVIYYNVNGKERVTFWEGIIDERDGSITTVEEYEILDGKTGKSINEMGKITKVGACIVAGCGAGAFRCLFTGPGYLKCLAIYCGGAFVGCGVAWLLGLF